MRFSQLTRPARAYVIGVYVLALGLLAFFLPRDAGAVERLIAETADRWTIFVPLLLAATLTHSFPVHTPNRQSYYVSLPFFTTAFLLLGPLQLATILLVPNLAEWRRQRRSWVAQLFNIAVYLIAGLAARATFGALHPAPFDATALGDAGSVAAAAAAVAVFLMLNHLLVIGAIALANRLQAFGLAELEAMAVETVLLGMGLPLATVLLIAPWALVPVAAPLLLMYRAFEMPHMRAERRHDEPTGLFTQAYLVEVCDRELNRGRRFGRPITLVVMHVTNFEAIAAAHGRDAGALVLHTAARLLAGCTREYDVAARVSESVFALLLPECDLDRAHAIASRLQTLIDAQRVEIPSTLEPLLISINVGIASDGGNDGETARAMLERASATLELTLTLTGSTPAASPAPVSRTSAAAAAAPPATLGAQAAEVETSSGAPPRSVYGVRASIALQVAVGLVAVVIVIITAPAMAGLDGWATAWMVGFVALTEVLGLELFGRSSYSISTVPIVAAGMLLGPAGAVLVAPVGILLRAIHLRTRWYKALFNVNAHVIGAAAAAWVFRWLAPDLSIDRLAWLVVPGALAGGTFYVHTLLVAVAMSTDLRVNPVRIWAEHFRWLWIQYVVLGVMGLLLAAAYAGFGLVGAGLFIVPAVMMRYVAKQYLDKTLDHVRQLRALNEHLANEVTQRKHSESTLEHQALHDVLTDLPNRLLLRDRAQQGLLAAHRDGHPLALLLLDLDRFKEVNDTFGHHAGDLLLQETGRRFRSVVRDADTVARLGGDEFAALLPAADLAAAVDAAKRLLGALDEPIEIEGRQVTVRTSIGIALAEAQGDTPEALLRRADVAMYAAKRGGRGYAVYAPDQDQNSPGAALRQCREWRDGGLDLAVAVNLSMRSLHDAGLPELIARLLGAHGLLPEALIIEMTESTLMADPQRALTILTELSHMGVRLSVDDYGTGYSSLAYLKQLPVNELKIDQAFVCHLATNPDDAAIVRSTIGLAHDLGLSVVAEGVEDERAGELLAAYGCDLAQGYFISRPVPAAQIPTIVRARSATSRRLTLAA